MGRRIRSASLIAFFLAACTAFLAGCGGSQTISTAPGSPSSPGSTSGSPFAVSSSVPTNGATNVALSSTIEITFSAAADAGSVNATDIVVDSSSAVAGSVTYNPSNNTATFTPSAALAADTTYTVKVSGVTGSNGTAMGSTDTFTFTTTAPAPPAGPLQYQATLEGNDTAGNFGQAAVDTSGNFYILLQGAPPGESFTAEFCAFIPQTTTTLNCFSLGTVNTDASGNGSLTAMFPKAGPWAGDFDLFTGSSPNPNTTVPEYSTNVAGDDTSQVYSSTLQPQNTVNAGTLNFANSTQLPLSSGTVTYASTPGTNGSLQFTINGGPANTTFSSTEGALEGGGSTNYGLVNSQGQSGFSTDSNGDVTFSVLQGGPPGDFFRAIPPPADNEQGYVGGFSVPQ
jgi:hypothetical protein